jgi:hypothetical protein
MGTGSGIAASAGFGIPSSSPRKGRVRAWFGGRRMGKFGRKRD